MLLINKYKTYLLVLFAMLMSLGINACNDSSNTNTNASGLNAITAFALNGVSGTIVGNNITVTVPPVMYVNSLIATFTTSGAYVTVNGVRQINSETENNFTNPVTYVVHAANGDTRSYIVTVIVSPSNSKAITAYSLNGNSGVITNNNIAVTVPNGTNVESLVATYTTTGTKVTVNGITQKNGVTTNNFESSVTYVVTAADNTTRSYIVSVTVAPSHAKAITQYSLDGYPGKITGTSITVTLPNGTNVNQLVATYTTTGASVTVGGATQVSGTTPNNFASPVTYVVHAVNGTIRNYTVTVTVAPSDAKTITKYSLEGNVGIITGESIAVSVPVGTDVSTLIATYTTTGASVTVGGTTQVSGVTPNNFTNPVTYVVHAADGTTNSYSVTVTLGGQLFGYVADEDSHIWQCPMASNGTFSAACAQLSNSTSPGFKSTNEAVFKAFNGSMYSYVTDSSQNLWQCPMNATGGFNSGCTASTNSGNFSSTGAVAFHKFNGTDYAYVADGSANLWQCTLAADGTLVNCVSATPIPTFTLGSSITFQTFSGQVYAYVTDFSQDVWQCTMGANGIAVGGCVPLTNNSPFNATSSVTFQTFNNQSYAYVTDGSTNLWQCPVTTSTGAFGVNCVALHANISPDFWFGATTNVTFQEFDGTMYAYVGDPNTIGIWQCPMTANGAIDVTEGCSNINTSGPLRFFGTMITFQTF